jgi:hypothetical protein
MNQDVVAWCRDCQHCARAKVTKQPAAAVQPIPVPCHRFTHVHVDLVGPLSTTPERYRYLFTMVDRTTRWLEADPLRDIEAATCAHAFTAAWVARFGMPSLLTSDQGCQFISSLWTRLCEQLCVQRQLNTAYHPQANGMVERVHRQLKDTLRPGWLARSGNSTSHGSLLAYLRRPRRILASPRQSFSMANPSPFPANSSPPRSLTSSSFCASCAKCSLCPPTRFSPRLPSSLPRPSSLCSLCTCGVERRPRLSPHRTRGLTK